MIKPESREISGYVCFKAGKSFSQEEGGYSRKVSVEAWFTPEIPFGFGPKGYAGFPGLILEFTENNITFYLKELKFADDEMYRIIDSIGQRNDPVEIRNFADLLNIEENRTNIWAAAQILEKLNVDNKTERQALEIIKKAACGVDTNALGFQLWLENYEKKE